MSRRVIDWARSGVPVLTGFGDGPPLIPPGHAATVADRHAARIAEATEGRVRLAGARLLSERAAYTGFTRHGMTSAGRHCRLLPTLDGWAAVSCARPDDPILLGALACADVRDDPWPAVADWVRSHTGAELAERAELLGVAAGPVGTVGPVETAQSTAQAATLPPRSVAGLRVVDFSALWAGPLCAHLLSLAGARVIKVETPGRPDGARRGDSEFYRLLHAGHESVVLDPDDDAQRDALAALVASADIVIEASRPRALARWGLDADRFVAAGGTWVSITAHGRESNRIGFGDDIAACAGLVARADDGTPLFVGDAIADPLSGLAAADLAMSRGPDGSGQLWDVDMSSVVATTLDPATQTEPAGDALLTAPRRRPSTDQAPVSGRDTAAVLAELGVAR
ncbi:CoA transferase [Gordonia sp. HY285]|uniref:CoA transferase n=1 Tax=Gordonia liuliyuniae TaxID=2911517 RepID=UPI001F459BD6|nr:CoA transferase [Gordonia liuliyuniae]MCF8609173.1 CoA transferase [Gordonia liuliyuniae]